MDSSVDEKAVNLAEKIEVEAEVHEQFEQSYEETDDVDGIVNVSTVEIQDIEGCWSGKVQYATRS